MRAAHGAPAPPSAPASATIPPSTGGGADASGGAFCRARLRALLLHQASAPSLVPKEVDLGDGVMEVQPAEEAAWAAAAAAALRRRRRRGRHLWRRWWWWW